MYGIIRFERHSETTVTIIRSQWIVIFLEMIQSPLNHLLVLKNSSHHSIPNSESVGFQSLGPGTRKTGTVLEPCWNLSLLGCKAGQMILVRSCQTRLPCMNSKFRIPRQGYPWSWPESKTHFPASNIVFRLPLSQRLLQNLRLKNSSNPFPGSHQILDGELRRLQSQRAQRSQRG